MELGRADLYDAFLLNDRGGDTIAAFIEALATRKLGSKRGELLDVGCGTGRMLTRLAALGFRVLGIDPDHDYLERARERTRGAENIELRAGGFLELDFDARFDACVAINGPLYYLRTPRERAEALRRVFRALRPGGIVLFDLANFLYLLRNGEREIAPSEAVLGAWKITRRVVHEIDYDAGVWIHHDELAIEGGEPRIVRESYPLAI